MKYTIRTLHKYHIAYGLLPYKRNQDVIKIHEFGGRRGSQRDDISILVRAS